MFFHLLKYRIKVLLKPSAELFWCIFFPYILATLFYLTLGSIMNSTETFSPIPVAIVTESSADSYAKAFIKQLSTDGDTKLLQSEYVSSDKADRLLMDNTVSAILYIGDSISLKVKKNEYDQSIVKAVIDEYTSTSSTIKELMQTNPDALKDALRSLTDSINANQEITLSKHSNLDTMASYFYALIAMSCLFDSFLGFKASISTQANLTALAARRTVTPVHKLMLILSDFVGCLIICSLNSCVLICYLAYCLHVNFGDRLPFVFLTAFTGTVVGISFGTFISTLGKGSLNLKCSIMVSVQMILSFFGGLMFNNMSDLVEKTCPLFNRVNPAALITNAIYSLSIYDSYGRFFVNLGLLLIIAILLTASSFFLTRRERYASI